MSPRSYLLLPCGSNGEPEKDKVVFFKVENKLNTTVKILCTYLKKEFLSMVLFLLIQHATDVQLDLTSSQENLPNYPPTTFSLSAVPPICSYQTGLCFSNSTCQDKFWILFVLSSTSAVFPIYFSCINLIDEKILQFGSLINIGERTDSHRAPVSNLSYIRINIYDIYTFSVSFPSKISVHPYFS